MKAEDIAEEILKQRKGEENNHALHLAVARADAKVEGMNQTVFGFTTPSMILFLVTINNNAIIAIKNKSLYRKKYSIRWPNNQKTIWKFPLSKRHD